MQLSAFIENGREEAKDDPVEEQAWDTANNSQEARITAAKNQRSYGSQTIIVEETIDTLNQPDDPQKNSHPMNNNISSAGETRPPLPENEHPLSHSSASAAALEGVPVSETQNEGNAHFRLTQNGWEKRRRDATGAFIREWKKTREFEPVLTYVGKPEPDELQRAALASFGQEYNRADDIARKKSLYESELKSLEPSSDRAQFLTKLIPLFDRAIAYQNEIMERLRSRKEEDKGLRSENQEERVAAERQAALRDSIRLENIMTINSRPNQVERLIEQIEEEEKLRLDVKERLAQVQTRLAVVNGLDFGQQDALSSAVAHFQLALDRYSKLLQARLDSARLIQPPYKKAGEIDPAIQDEIKASRRDLLKKKTLFECAYLDGKNWTAKAMIKEENTPFVSSEHTLSSDLFHKAHFALEKAEREAWSDEPLEKVIHYYFQAAICYEGALEGLFENKDDSNRMKRADWLMKAGDSLDNAAFGFAEVGPEDEWPPGEPYGTRRFIEQSIKDAAQFKSRAEALPRTSSWWPSFLSH